MHVHVHVHVSMQMLLLFMHVIMYMYMYHVPFQLHKCLWIIYPLRMFKRVTVVCLSVCVCLSVNALTARVLISALQPWYKRNRRGTSEVFDSWILLKSLCSTVTASFTFRSKPPYMMYCRQATSFQSPTALPVRPLTALSYGYCPLSGLSPQ